MPLYVAEFQFRYNNRENADIFGTAIRRMLKYLAIAASGSAIVLFASLVGMLVFYSSKQPEPYNRNQPSTTEHRDSKNSGAGTNETARNRNDESSQKSEWYYSFVERPTDWLLVLFNGLLVLATVALFVSGERNVEVARESANAAQQSANVAKIALISTQRAFVFITTFESHVIATEFRILPKWENSGSTPANPIKNYANWKAFIGEPPLDYTYPDLGKDGNPLHDRSGGISFFLGPKAVQYSEILKIPIPIMEQVRQGKFRLFIWGWAQYHDAFEGTPIHTTRYCNEVVVTDLGRDGDKVSVTVSFGSYGPYNSAD